MQTLRLHIAGGLGDLHLAGVLSLQHGGFALLRHSLPVGNLHLCHIFLNPDVQLLFGLQFSQLQLGFGLDGRLGQILLAHLQDGLQHIVAQVTLLGQHNAHNQELGDYQAVVVKAFLQSRQHGGGQAHLLLIQLQNVQLFFGDDVSKIGGNRQLNQAAEIVADIAFAVGNQILTGQLAAGANQLQQQLTGVGDPEIQHTTGADGNGCAALGLQEVDLLGGAPLDGQLMDQIEEVDLAVEGAFRVGGQLIQLFQHRQLLGFQGIAAGSEGVQRLAVPEENGLLGLVDDQLGTQVEVLNGVLPDQGIRIAFVFNDGGKTLLLDLFSLDPLGHIVYMVADGAGVCRGGLGGAQPDAALGAGKFHGLILLRHGVDGLTANRTLGSGTLALVEYHIVAAVDAGAAGQLVGAHIDGVTAAAVDLLLGKEAGLGLYIFPTIGTFHNKFSHFLYLLR